MNRRAIRQSVGGVSGWTDRRLDRQIDQQKAKRWTDKQTEGQTGGQRQKDVGGGDVRCPK